MGEPIAPEPRHLPLPESRAPTYTGFSPSPSDVAAWQEQPRRIAQWRDEVPVRSKAMGKSVQPESGSCLSMGKGAGVGSAEWSERDKDQPGEVARGGGTADSYKQVRTAGTDVGAVGQRASVRQMGSSTSDKKLPRRPDPLVLGPPAGTSSTLLVPVPNTTKSMRVLSPSRRSPQRSVSDNPPRSLPSVHSTRSQREAYIADALAIPDELSRPNLIMPVARVSHLNVRAEAHTDPLPVRQSRSAASRESALEQQGRDADVRKAKSSSSNRLPMLAANPKLVRHDPPMAQPHTYRSAATTPVNPNANAVSSLAPPVQSMHHGRPSTVYRQPSPARIRQSSTSHLQIPAVPQTRRSSSRSYDHESAHRNPTTLQPTLNCSHSSQREHLGDHAPVRQSGTAGLRTHFDPQMYPLPSSVMTSPTLVAAPEEKAQTLRSPIHPERQRTISHPARITSSSRQNQFRPTSLSPELVTPTDPRAIEHINISAPDGNRPDLRESHPHPSAQSSELSAGQPDHISFEVPSGTRGRLRVSLAWFRDRETGGRRRRRHTDTPQSPDSSVPPPLPPKHDPPPRSHARREDERSDERRDRGRQPPLQGRPSDDVPSPQASPRRYDTSPSQYPAQMGGNPMLQRSNTYMTNLPPYQATVPAYRVQFPHNLPVPMQYPHPGPYGNPTGWAVNSMPQLQVPPPSLVSPTRCGPPGTAPFLDQGRSAYHAPPSPRRPPSIEPPTKGSPPAPLRRLPSARLGMSPGTQAYMAPTGYGGMGAAQNGRMPLVTPVVIGIGRGGAMAQEDMMTQRYGQQQPNMWKRMFGGHRRDSDRERYPERYPEHPTEGRIKRWRMNVGRGQPSGPQEERRTEYAPDQRRAERDRGREGKGYGEGRSMLGRFFGNRSRPRQPYTAVDHPADPAVAGPRITPFLSRRPTRPLPSPIPAPIPEGPYTPAPDTKFGNLTLRGRSRRFKTYQPTQLDRSETQRRQREVGRQRQKEAKREEKRTLRRKQREERDAQRAMAREARIRAATGGALGGGLGRSGVREMGQEKGKLQRKPSGRDAGKSGDTRIEGPGLIGQRTGGGIGEWLAKVQRNRG